MLKWEKKGERTWYAEDGWLRYHIERDHAGVYRVARGGIASADWFASSLYYSVAKSVAQDDATKREDKIQALPDYVGK